MKSRWWNVFDAMVEISFKPTMGGFVYRAPSLWPFASGRHYLVNEQQKAILAGYHLGMFRTLFWLIVVGAGIAGPLAGAAEIAASCEALASDLLSAISP